MQLLRFGLTSLLILTLAGCSLLRPEAKVITVTNTVKTTVPPAARPKPVQMNNIKIYVVNKDNYDLFVEEFTKKNGELVYIAISVKDYENLSLNIAELRRYLNQQKEIIVYYEEATKAEDIKPISK